MKDLTPSLPKVALPGVDQEAVEALDVVRAEGIRRRLLASISLARMGKHVYAGTVSPAEIRRRRAASKRAKVARRAAW